MAIAPKTGNSGHVGNSELLKDARFWSRIMKEHTIFIEGGLPCDQTALIARARALRQRFQALQDRLEQADRITPDLLRDLIAAVEDIIAYKKELLRLLVQCQLNGNLFPLLVDHLRREAVHFLGLLQDPSLRRPDTMPIMFILRREVFWLRIMKEHVEFVIHLLDPSERMLLVDAEGFRAAFDRLLQTANDLESMAESEPRTFNAVKRFTEEVIGWTLDLRNFKATAHELLLLCQLLSIATPLLADHIRREADKFLEELAEFKPTLNGTSAV